MGDRLGVRGRLLMAFFGISAFAVLAAAAAMHSFLEVGNALDKITPAIGRIGGPLSGSDAIFRR